MTTPTLTELALDTFADPGAAGHEFCRSPLHPGPCKGWKQAKAQGRDHTVTHDDLIPGPRRRRPNARSAEDEARARQAAINHARTRADVLAEIEERIIGGEDNPIVLQRAAEQVARRHGVDTDLVIAALLRQLDDPAVADDRVARAAAALGLERIGGTRGQTVQQVPFNPAEHVSIGGRPAARTTVEVVRPGYAATIGGHRVVVSKAAVEPVARNQTADAWTPADEAKVERDAKGRFAEKVGADVDLPRSSRDTVAAGDFRGLQQVGLRQGFNPGGLYEAADGSRWYVKEHRSEENARNENLANAFYRALYFDVPYTHVGTGAPGLEGPQLAAEWVDTEQPDLPPTERGGDFLARIRTGFAVDAWLANWDVAGAGGRHNIESVDGGFPLRIDQGGALLSRGTGRPKGDMFTETADEWDTLRDPSLNPKAARLFADMTDAEMAESAEQLFAIKPTRIRKMVKDHGFGDDLAAKLIARRADILDRGEEAALKAETQANPPQPGQPRTGRYALTAAPLRLQDQDIDLSSENRADIQDFSALIPRTGDPGWGEKGTEFRARLLRFYRGGTWRDLGAFARAEERGEYYDPKITIRENYTDPPVTEDLRDHQAYLSDTFGKSRLSEPVEVWRGVGSADKIFGDAWGPNMAGATWIERSPTSTSADPAVGRGFAAGAEPVIMRVHVPAGVGAIQLSGWQSQHRRNAEAELALQPYLRFRVIGDNMGTIGTSDRQLRILDVVVEELDDDE